jgi:hypothetical protein
MTLAREYEDLQAQMDSAFDGETLRRAAGFVLGSVPEGESVTFIATSISGAGLAATCAALYRGTATWAHLNLLVPADLPRNSRNVVVEMVDGGDGWRQALARRVARHTVIIPEVVETLALA